MKTVDFKEAMSGNVPVTVRLLAITALAANLIRMRRLEIWCFKRLPISTAWRCFHCGEVFTDPEDARLHFGDDCSSDAACQITAGSVRDMELQLARYRAEDSDADRAMYRMRAEHTIALRRAEEDGYRRGLVDQVFTNG